MLNIRVAGNSTLCSSHQAWEIWQCHGAWVRENKPGFGPGIRERFEMAASITQEVRGAGADAFPVMLRDSFSRTLTLPIDELFVAYCLCYQNLTVPASCVLPPLQERDLNSAKRSAIKEHLSALLGDDGFLALPTAPGPAPFLETPALQLDGWRRSMIGLTCIAGLAGLPQVHGLLLELSSRVGRASHQCMMAGVLRGGHIQALCEGC